MCTRPSMCSSTWQGPNRQHCAQGLYALSPTAGNPLFSPRPIPYGPCLCGCACRRAAPLPTDSSIVPSPLQYAEVEMHLRVCHLELRVALDAERANRHRRVATPRTWKSNSTVSSSVHAGSAALLNLRHFDKLGGTWVRPLHMCIPCSARPHHLSIRAAALRHSFLSPNHPLSPTQPACSSPLSRSPAVIPSVHLRRHPFLVIFEPRQDSGLAPHKTR